MARRLFGGVDVVGRHIRVGNRQLDQAVEIVGIAGDAVLDDPRAGRTLFVFLNYWQEQALYQQWPVLLVRTEGIPTHVVGSLRTHVEEAGHEHVTSVHTMNQSRDASIVQQRLLAVLAGAFGLLALSLAFMGLFGLLNFIVASRTREIGIRMALGADRWGMRWLVWRDALRAIATGTVLGIPLVLIGGRAVSALLYGVSPLDGRVLVPTIAILILAGLVAAWLPARRATKVDPLVALRCE